MASVTFVGILSELMPSGILPQMTEGLGVTESQVGFLVGVYALASAICAIPLVSATLAVDRKTLLMALLIGFAVSNIVVAVSSSYEVIVARSEEHTSELQSLMRISYAVFCLKKKNQHTH